MKSNTKSKKTLIVGIFVIVIILGVVLFTRINKSPKGPGTGQPSQNSQSA